MTASSDASRILERLFDLPVVHAVAQVLVTIACVPVEVHVGSISSARL